MPNATPKVASVVDTQSVTLRQDVQNAARVLAAERDSLDLLRGALDGELGIRLNQAVDVLTCLKGRLIITGIGKSGHIGRKLAATFSSTGTPAHFVHPADASHGDLGMIRGEDVVMALSWSGESAELSDIVAYTRRYYVPLIAITARAESALGIAADIALVLPDVPEACPHGWAPTTSTTVQLVLGDALAICLLSRRNFSPEDFKQFHPGGQLGARLRQVRDLMHRPPDVPIVSMESSLTGAILEMTSKRLGVTGIIDEAGKLVGVISDGDLRRAFEKGFYDRPAAEIMSRNPRLIVPEALAQQALARLNAERITSLFILHDDGKPAGIITVHDLLQAGIS